MVQTIDTRRPVRAPEARWFLGAVLSGALLGPLDLLGQVVAPYPWAHLFNSPAVWAAAAFGLGRWIADANRSLLAGALQLVVAVEAYYLADVVARDAAPANLTSPTAAVWLVAAVAAGALFGLAGCFAAGREGWRAVAGRAALPAVLVAEAFVAVGRVATEPAAGRPDDLGWYALILTGLAIAACAILVRSIAIRLALRVCAVAVLVGGVVGLAVVVVR